MKRLYLIITLICPAAFAQEQDEIGIGGSPMVGGVVLGNSDSSKVLVIGLRNFMQRGIFPKT